MNVAQLAGHHNPEAKKVWMVFTAAGHYYFTTTWNLGPEVPRWREAGYVVKEIDLFIGDGDVLLEVVG